MTSHHARRPSPDVASALAAEAEGFLLARSHRAAARREAQTLCDALPWLTTAQAEELTRHYISHRIAVSRQMLSATVHRADELRREYEARYQQLRGTLLRRHAAWASGVLACAVAVSGALCALAR
ncbi:hypothetical protein [Streptomyces griseoloalbus]|uniref:Uncharacterized protein n=1 Tax=Streptomyces griseoloalbus TaxID=67303 RepID=A0A7W8F781_9ACTN|nr:hypothetical protein [Streptomyces albaduncus]MBB5123919.1 hypothetical protein [Streptomyces albaduncus]GGW77641.1 hypothetical protein GCM10010340_65210 [Streptomyces albaduncus]